MRLDVLWYFGDDYTQCVSLSVYAHSILSAQEQRGVRSKRFAFYLKEMERQSWRLPLWLCEKDFHLPSEIIHFNPVCNQEWSEAVINLLESQMRFKKELSLSIEFNNWKQHEEVETLYKVLLRWCAS